MAKSASFLITAFLVSAVLLHGFLVGLLVAVLSFLLDLRLRRAIELGGLTYYVLMITAGMLGSVLGSTLGGRRRE
jgi:hypothetical protein